MSSSVKSNLFFLALLFVFVLLGYFVGVLHTTKQYTQMEIEYQEEINKIKDRLKDERNQHILKQQESLAAMTKLKESHEEAISVIQSQYTDRLLQSEQRGNLYRRKASTAGAEARELAEHAARLDRALTEGRELVRELREHIAQHRVAFTEVTSYLIEDRNQLNER